MGGAGGPMGGAGGPMGMGGPMGGAGSGAAASGLFTDRPIYLTIHPDLKRMMDKMEESPEPAILSCAGMDLESASAKIVDNVRATSTLGALIPLPTIISAGLGIQRVSETRLTIVAALELKREDDARTLTATLSRDVIGRAALMLSKWLGTPIDGNAPVATSAGPGVAGGARPGPMGGGGGPMGGMAGPMGGMAGPMGGGAPRAGQAGPMGGAGSTQFAPSSLHARSSGKTVYITLEAEVSTDADRKIKQGIENQTIRLKGMADVAGSIQPRWHELANTAVLLKNQNRVLHGTMGAADDPSGRTLVPRGPHQRVSFMVDLLPMLGRTEIFNEIDTKLPWRSDKNLRAGANWVPQFINPQYPRLSWQAQLPSLPGTTLGATHYVGLSGVGLDSADWDDNDPALRKKFGMFGYNRPTKFDDIPDGTSSTIYLITVPPTASRPWIAGGGATVQGVPEQGSIAPFVYNHGTKRGAYALMADGSVRFLSADMADKAFQALVTKAGSDDAGDLETLAPKANAPIAVAPTPRPKVEPKAEPVAVKSGPLDEAQKDRAALQGEWEIVSAESNGEPPPPGLLSQAKFAFSGDNLTLMGKVGTFTIDAGRIPRQIDFASGNVKQLGIYDLDGDRLRLCVGPADDRPKEFKTKPRTDHSMFVLKRKR